jgi:hypothetical protein
MAQLATPLAAAAKLYAEAPPFGDNDYGWFPASALLQAGNNLAELTDAATALANLGAVEEAPEDGNQYARRNAAWEAVAAGGVTSVFGRSGAVVAQADDYSAAQITGLAAVALSNDYDDLDNLPSLFSGDYNDLINTPTLGTLAAEDWPASDGQEYVAKKARERWLTWQRPA